MSGCSLVVLKFGSSVLRSEDDLAGVAGEISTHVARDWRVLAVTSAIGNGTERLIRRAGGVARSSANELDASAQAAFAALLATGEATAAALVSLALDRRGIASTLLDIGRVGPFTRGPQLDAVPHALDTHVIKRALSARPVAILPGFVGRDGDGHCTLLGRGGSDLTALFAAHTLHAERCRLLKDVDGIYEHDPALRGCGKPRRFATLDWEDALRLDDCILQQKGAQFAYRHRVPFEVGALGDSPGTLVGAAESRLVDCGVSRVVDVNVARAAEEDPGSGAPRSRRCDRSTRPALAAEGGLAS